jgi:hypothetical protein
LPFGQVIRNEIQTLLVADGQLLHIFLHLLLNCCHSLSIGFVIVPDQTGLRVIGSAILSSLA